MLDDCPKVRDADEHAYLDDGEPEFDLICRTGEDAFVECYDIDVEHEHFDGVFADISEQSQPEISPHQCVRWAEPDVVSDQNERNGCCGDTNTQQENRVQIKAR